MDGVDWVDEGVFAAESTEDLLTKDAAGEHRIPMWLYILAYHCTFGI